MISQKIQFFSKTNIINLLIAIIPFSYIAGNLVLNLNVIILIILALIFYGKNLFIFKFNNIDKLIFLLFLYILANGIYNNFLNFDFPESSNKNLILEKSISYIRHFLFYISLRFLILNKIINYKIMFLSFGISSLLVSIDIIFQYIVGFDLLGFKAEGRRLSGPFGSELIAGSFLQRFWIFSLFSLLLFFNIKNKISFNLATSSLLLVITLGIIFSGNRIPLVLFLMMVFIIFVSKRF